MSVNPMEFCSPIELFSETVLYDHTVEFIGRVNYFEGTLTANTRYGPKQVIRVLITNVPHAEEIQPWEVQLSIFEEYLEALSPFIIKNHVIHVDGAFSTTKGPAGNNIRVNFDLTAHMNTIINTVGIYKPPTIDSEKPAITVSIPDILNHAGKLVEVKDFLRMEFDVVSKYDHKLIGSITDLKYKIDIQCPDSSFTKIELGEEIKIIGRVDADFPPFIEVQSAKDIIKMDTVRKSKMELYRGNKLPQPDNNSTLAKKPRI